MRNILRAAGAVLIFASAAIAADDSRPAVAAPAASTAASLKTYAAADLDTLKSVKGQKVVLEGTVVKLGANKTESIRYLNFTPDYHTSASLVFFANSSAGKFTKEKLGEFVGKKVQATGVLSEYNSALQMKIESLDQIKIVEETTPAPPVK